MPEGAPPGDTKQESESDDDDIPLPEGPPPPKALAGRLSVCLRPTADFQPHII